jgi:hypothetical protein
LADGELSKHALVVVNSLFRGALSQGMKLSFNTPSKIHPTMLDALNELVTAKVLTKKTEKLAGGQKWTFSLLDPSVLDTVPKMSMKDIEEHGFPITKD